MISHPADGSQWRNLNREYPQFDNDPRNIRFALSADGMNPYGEFGSAHSTWPVTLCMFNIPPWLCLKRKFIMILLGAQGKDHQRQLTGILVLAHLLHCLHGTPAWIRHHQPHKASPVRHHHQPHNRIIVSDRGHTRYLRSSLLISGKERRKRRLQKR